MTMWPLCTTVDAEDHYFKISEQARDRILWWSLFNSFFLFKPNWPIKQLKDDWKMPYCVCQNPALFSHWSGKGLFTLKDVYINNILHLLLNFRWNLISLLLLFYICKSETLPHFNKQNQLKTSPAWFKEFLFIECCYVGCFNCAVSLMPLGARDLLRWWTVTGCNQMFDLKNNLESSKCQYLYSAEVISRHFSYRAGVVCTTEAQHFPMSKHMATATRKKSPLTGRNLEQIQPCPAKYFFLRPGDFRNCLQ